MIIRVKVTPISTDMVAVGLNCQCGNDNMREEATNREYEGRSYLIGGEHPSLSPRLICKCGRRYQVTSLKDEIVIHEIV